MDNNYKQYPPLYKIDSKGKLRIWFIETDVDLGYRVTAGLYDGKRVVNAFKEVKPKNVGRANETSVSEQIEKEVAALYDNQTRVEGYWPNIEDAGKGKSYFAPMLADKYVKITPKKIVASQPKFDGFRCIVYEDRIHSREGEPFYSVPHIQEQLSDLTKAYPNLRFDGELYNHDLKDDFAKIQSLLTRQVGLTEEHYAETLRLVQYHVYDLFDVDRPWLKFKERNALLQELLKTSDRPNIIPVETVYCEGHDAVVKEYVRLIAEGYEGQMVREPDTPYEVDKRSKTLKKHKPTFDFECTIVDIKEGVGNWAGAAKQATVYNAELDLTTDVGIAGERDFLKTVFNEREKYIGTLATIEHMGVTKHKKLRFGILKKFWMTEQRKY